MSDVHTATACLDCTLGKFLSSPRRRRLSGSRRNKKKEKNTIRGKRVNNRLVFFAALTHLAFPADAEGGSKTESQMKGAGD